jgi:tripartite-type tricarboxylate transporter receptor subunit TctC
MSQGERTELMMGNEIGRALRSLLAMIGGMTLLAVAAIGTPAQSDEFPSRAITVIVPFPPGGSSDIVMRLVAQKVSESIQQPIIIDNRPGGAGNLAAMVIKNAPPDVYLLMMGHTGTHAVNPSLYHDLKFDPIKDFAPITALIAFNNILVVPAASPAKSVAELVAFAKTKPDGLNYGSQGIGTGGHLLGELLAKHAGVKLIHVPYRGIAPAVTDTVAGRMDFLFSSYISAAGHIESGQLRMLAIAGPQRHPRIPDVPTMAEAGYPDIEFDNWFGVFVPAGTPGEIIALLNREIVNSTTLPDVRARLVTLGFDPVGSTPAEFRKQIEVELEKWTKVIRAANIKAQ